MTKSELIEKVVLSHEMLNAKVSEIVVNTVFDSIEEDLAVSQFVSVSGVRPGIRKAGKLSAFRPSVPHSLKPVKTSKNG